ERDICIFASLSEGSILGEESIARMDRFSIPLFPRIDYFGDDEVAFSRRSGSNRERLISHTYMECPAIRFGIQCGCPDTHFSACANDANGNLTAIRYEDLLKHVMHRPLVSHKGSTQ